MISKMIFPCVKRANTKIQNTNTQKQKYINKSYDEVPERPNMWHIFGWRKLMVSHCWLRYVGPEKVEVGPEKGTGWHGMEERVADRRPFPSHFTTNTIALHCIAWLIRSSPLSPRLFLPGCRVPREAFCSCLAEKSPLAFHNWITLVSGPHPAPLGWGRRWKSRVTW